MTLARYEFRNYFNRFLRRPYSLALYLFGGFIAWFGFWTLIFVIRKENLLSFTTENLSAFVQMNKIFIGTLFFLIISYTLYFTLGKRRGRNLEILFSTPIDAKDIFLGSLLAISPVYTLLFCFVSVPYFLFMFLVLEISLLGIIITLLSFFLVFFSALAIGESLALTIDAYIKKLLLKFPHLRFLLGLIGFLLYLSLFYGRYIFSNEEGSSFSLRFLGQVITLLPSSLALQILYETIKPAQGGTTNYIAVFFYLSVLILLIGSILGIGMIWANKVLSLTEAFEVVSAVIGTEGFLERSFRKLLKRLPIDYSEPIMIQLKLLIRDPHAIQRIAITLASILIATPLLGVVAIIENQENPIFQENPIIQTTILIGMMTILIMPLSIIPFTTTTFYLSKEQMWIWDQTPYGRREFMNSKTIQALLLLLPCPFLFFIASLIPLSVVNYPSIGTRLGAIIGVCIFSILGGIFLINSVLLGMVISSLYPVTEIRGSGQARNSFLILTGLVAIHVPIFVIILTFLSIILPLPPTPPFIFIYLILTLFISFIVVLGFLIMYYRHIVSILEEKDFLTT